MALLAAKDLTTAKELPPVGLDLMQEIITCIRSSPTGGTFASGVASKEVTFLLLLNRLMPVLPTLYKL